MPCVRWLLCACCIRIALFVVSRLRHRPLLFPRCANFSVITKWLRIGAATLIVAGTGVVVGLLASSSEPSPAVPVAGPLAASPKRRSRSRTRRTPSPHRREAVPPNGDDTDGDDTDGYETDGYETDGYVAGYSTDSSPIPVTVPVAVPVATSSKRRGRSRTRRKPSLERRDSSIASDEEKAQKRAIVLRNGSSYTVSYFVLREENMTTKSVETEVEKKILASLNCSVANGPGVSLSAKRSSAKITKEENLPTFLLQDHRVLPSLCPGNKDHDEVGTKIRYPKRCRNLRVFGFFHDEGQWKQYKNKVYRVGEKRTSHVVTAMNSQILGHL